MNNKTLVIIEWYDYDYSYTQYVYTDLSKSEIESWSTDEEKTWVSSIFGNDDISTPAITVRVFEPEHTPNVNEIVLDITPLKQFASFIENLLTTFIESRCSAVDVNKSQQQYGINTSYSLKYKIIKASNEFKEFEIMCFIPLVNSDIINVAYIGDLLQSVRPFDGFAIVDYDAIFNLIDFENFSDDWISELTRIQDLYDINSLENRVMDDIIYLVEKLQDLLD